MKNNNIPKLRYPEFTDAWEKCKLGEVANIIMGQSPSSEFYTNNPSDYILVQGNADIKNGWVTPRIWTTQITKMGKKGDLIFSVRAPVGEIGKTKYDVVLGRGVAAIQGNEFIFQTLGRMNIFGFWKSLSTGSTFDAINSSELKNVEIHLPTLPEQQKIGALFRRLDRLITLHKRKWDDVILLKKALLQKMFPKNGSNFPALRFPEFTDAWEKCKLGEVKDVRDGTHSSPKFYTDGYALITSKNLTEFGLDLSSVSFISQQDFDEINKRSKVDIGDIIFGMIGTIGNPILLEKEGFAIKNVALIKQKEGEAVDNLFLIQLLKSSIFNNYIAKENTGGTQKFLGLAQVRSFSFFNPTLPEQQKIGTLFRRLDRLITLHKRQHEHYQLLKKALLQQMFV
ncbi:restriction endonuclease subunit S [Avibacterium paragallinarum]|uniref:restriction endonuclease subunit S n=1 Tax=Avibacterium paragallinarum TaxID=728 RepID=UPI00397AD91C